VSGVSIGNASWVLHLADCLAGMRELAELSVDAVISDPPYSEHVHGNARSTNGKEHAINFAALSEGTRMLAAQEFARLARRWVLVFCEIEGAHLWRVALQNAGLEYIRTGLWVRTNGMPQVTGDRPAAGAEAIVIAHRAGRKKWNGGGRPGVWKSPLANDTETRLHPTQKPELLMEMLVRDFTERGEIVLDPFAGSGTTGVACLRNGRRFIGFEQDEKFHAAAAKRLASTREQLGLFGAA
jgi:DNA modification methylase